MIYNTERLQHDRFVCPTVGLAKKSKCSFNDIDMYVARYLKSAQILPLASDS